MHFLHTRLRASSEIVFTTTDFTAALGGSMVDCGFGTDLLCRRPFADPRLSRRAQCADA